ncbi:hypothetical protein XELAEV_18029581mg [Xenopus laevis]|uniref:Secreted protein n=1 Tax=Xenopus laevis TaxID=8355 RepID=A0A974HHS0_XENLA|nr:hypothetical protein XELAEV_18029581mg [Xenopus laevis]
MATIHSAALDFSILAILLTECPPSHPASSVRWGKRALCDSRSGTGAVACKRERMKCVMLKWIIDHGWSL